jgi:hypothetical protein
MIKKCVTLFMFQALFTPWRHFFLALYALFSSKFVPFKDSEFETPVLGREVKKKKVVKLDSILNVCMNSSFVLVE